MEKLRGHPDYPNVSNDVLKTYVAERLEELKDDREWIDNEISVLREKQKEENNNAWWNQRLPNLNGVLCWVSDNDPCPTGQIAAIICREEDTGLFEVKSNKWRYRYAIPLTNEEIDKFKR